VKTPKSFLRSGIRTTIGDDFHLPRTGVITKLLDELESSRVVLVAGTAGIGKSGCATTS
jgi:hypothetical protein